MGITKQNLNRIHGFFQLISSRDLQAYILRSKGIGLALLTSYCNILVSKFPVIEDIGNVQGCISFLIAWCRELDLSYFNSNFSISSISYRITCKCFYKFIVFRSNQLFAGESMLFAFQTICFQNLGANRFITGSINNGEGSICIGFFRLCSIFLHGNSPVILIDVFLIFYRKVHGTGVNAIFLAVNCDNTKISSFQ